MERISVGSLLTAVKNTHPELVKEFGSHLSPEALFHEGLSPSKPLSYLFISHFRQYNDQ